ncbi:MAG: hypothetical protein BGO83_05000 [Devosia sp. 66-14]|nr:MAG: hypothetical protein BGO83_05000 [Devosia sp. 66-14]
MLGIDVLGPGIDPAPGRRAALLRSRSGIRWMIAAWAATVVVVLAAGIYLVASVLPLLRS